jgi:hypothetical protein
MHTILYNKILKFKRFFLIFIPGTEKRAFHTDCDCPAEVILSQLFVDEVKLKLRPKSSLSTILFSFFLSFFLMLLALFFFSVRSVIDVNEKWVERKRLSCFLCFGCTNERRIYELLRGKEYYAHITSFVNHDLCQGATNYQNRGVPTNLLFVGMSHQAWPWPTA